MRTSSALKKDLSGRKLSTLPTKNDASNSNLDRGRLVRELLSLGNPKITADLAQQIGEEVEQELRRRSSPTVSPELISELVQFKLEELGLLEIRRRGAQNSKPATPTVSNEDEQTVSLYPEDEGHPQNEPVSLAAKMAATRPGGTAKSGPLPPKTELKMSVKSRARLQQHYNLTETDLTAQLEARLDHIASLAIECEAKSPSSQVPEVLAVEFFNGMANQEFYPSLPALLDFLEPNRNPTPAAEETVLGWDTIQFATGALLDAAHQCWIAGTPVSFSFADNDNVELPVFEIFLEGIERRLMDLPETAPFPKEVGFQMKASHPRAAEFSECALSGKYYPKFRFDWILSEGISSFEDESFATALKMTWKKSEPSLVFLDEADGASCISRPSNLESGRPGGTPALSQWGAVSLGSLNLSIAGAVSDVDWAKLRRMTRSAVHLLQNLSLRDAATEVAKSRRCGLGVMGFAELLLKLGIPYDSDDAAVLADKVFRFLREEVQRAAQALAEQRSARAPQDAALPRPATPEIFLTLERTTALAELAEVSPALDPLSALVSDGRILPLLKQIAQRRKVWSEALEQEVLSTGSLRLVESAPRPLRRLFAIRQEIGEEWPLKVAGAAHRHFPSEETLELRLPEGAGLEELRDKIQEYLSYGLRRFKLVKNPELAEEVEASIPAEGENVPDPLAAEAAEASLFLTLESLGAEAELEVSELTEIESIDEPSIPNEVFADPELAPESLAAAIVGAENLAARSSPLAPGLKPRERAEVLQASNRVIQTGCGPLHVSFARDKQGPYEVRASLGRSGSCSSAQTETISRLLSLCLSSGIDQDLVYRQLRGQRCPKSAVDHGEKIRSCSDGIARVFERELGLTRAEDDEEITAVTSVDDLH